MAINGTPGDDHLVGTVDNDEINGFAGNDTLSGLAGDDRLFGGPDDDFLFGHVGDDRLFGGAGNDRLFGDSSNSPQPGNSFRGSDTLDGGIGDDVLSGESQNDRVLGGPGNDSLRGGYGADELRGGEGADTFGFAGFVQFFPEYETGVGAGNRDRIIDFDGTEGDKIDVRICDADLTVANTQHFTFVGEDLPGKGEIGFFETATRTIVRANSDNDAAAEFEIQLNGIGHDLSVDDFIL